MATRGYIFNEQHNQWRTSEASGLRSHNCFTAALEPHFLVSTLCNLRLAFRYFGTKIQKEEEESKSKHKPYSSN